MLPFYNQSLGEILHYADLIRIEKVKVYNKLGHPYIAKIKKVRYIAASVLKIKEYRNSWVYTIETGLKEPREFSSNKKYLFWDKNEFFISVESWSKKNLTVSDIKNDLTGFVFKNLMIKENKYKKLIFIGRNVLFKQKKRKLGVTAITFDLNESIGVNRLYSKNRIYKRAYKYFFKVKFVRFHNISVHLRVLKPSNKNKKFYSYIKRRSLLYWLLRKPIKLKYNTFRITYRKKLPAVALRFYNTSLNTIFDCSVRSLKLAHTIKRYRRFERRRHRNTKVVLHARQYFGFWKLFELCLSLDKQLPSLFGCSHLRSYVLNDAYKRRRRRKVLNIYRLFIIYLYKRVSIFLEYYLVGRYIRAPFRIAYRSFIGKRTHKEISLLSSLNKKRKWQRPSLSRLLLLNCNLVHWSTITKYFFIYIVFGRLSGASFSNIDALSVRHIQFRLKNRDSFRLKKQSLPWKIRQLHLNFRKQAPSIERKGYDGLTNKVTNWFIVDNPITYLNSLRAKYYPGIGFRPRGGRLTKVDRIRIHRIKLPPLCLLTRFYYRSRFMGHAYPKKHGIFGWRMFKSVTLKHRKFANNEALASLTGQKLFFLAFKFTEKYRRPNQGIKSKWINQKFVRAQYSLYNSQGNTMQVEFNRRNSLSAWLDEFNHQK